MLVRFPADFGLRVFFIAKQTMQIIKDKALLFTTRKAEQITQVIPKSHVVETRGDKSQLLVQWNLDTFRILRNLGIKNVPHPIRRDYDWPGMYAPMAHQKVTAEGSAAYRRFYILNEMGTAKTISVAWAADYLMNIGEVNKVLVLCPLSIMESAWQSDLFKSVMHRKVGIAHGTRAVRQRVIHGDYDFVVMNHDGITLMADEVKKAKFDLIIIDELNCFKTHNTNRSRALQSVITPSTWVWGMTGSPAAQSPADAYGLAKIVRPDTVRMSYSRFRDEVMYKVTPFKWAPKADAKQKVFALLQPAVRFTKAECLDLPEQTFVDEYIPMSPQQKKYYDTIRKAAVAEVAGSTISAVNAGALANKLAQISAGCVYINGETEGGAQGDYIMFDITPRLNRLLDIIEEAAHKVIVFAPFKHIIAELQGALLKKGVTSEVISGDVGRSKRTQIFEKFQTQEAPRVIIIQPQAAAHGVTLTAADTVVWWGAVASTETYIQANARPHRAGQKNPVTVVHLYSSPAEKRIFSILKNNLNFHISVVDMFSEIVA